LGGYDVLFLFTMETCDPFNGHIVALGGPRRKDNVLRVSTDEIGNVLNI
jgi:hypothetical protein